MPAPEPGFLAAWRGTLPLRWRGLVVPYGQALGMFLAGYAGATALFRPWALGGWWQFWVPLAAGLVVCWWLWRPWALLARTYKGESRRLPLMLMWMLMVVLGLHLRTYLYARLGEVRDLADTRALATPGDAVYFRLHGTFYPDKLHLGRYTTTDARTEKNGTKRYTADCYYACPLLATAADTASHAAPLAWLTYTDQDVLGYNLTPGERNWRYQNFVARADARLDSLNPADFTYLERDENPDYDLYQAVQASRARAYGGVPLLLVPVQAPFAARGAHALRRLWQLALIGSGFIIILLLVMPLRDGDWLVLQAPLGPPA